MVRRSPVSCGRLRHHAAGKRDCSATLLLAACVAFGAPGFGVWAAEGESPWQSWSRLRLRAKAMLFFSGAVEFHRELVGDNTLLRTRTTARFMGARIASSETWTSFETRTGRPEMYVSKTRKRARRFSFGKDRYTVEKLVPDGDRDAPLDDWQVTSSKEFSYPTSNDGNPLPLFDYYGMLFQLKRMRMEAPGDEVIVQVATTKGPVPYKIGVAEARSAEQSYRAPSPPTRRTNPVRQLRLSITPADPERAGESFLNMEGEIELWVEATSKTLLSVAGKVPKVPGRVRLELTELDP